MAATGCHPRKSDGATRPSRHGRSRDRPPMQFCDEQAHDHRDLSGILARCLRTVCRLSLFSHAHQNRSSSEIAFQAARPSARSAASLPPCAFTADCGVVSPGKSTRWPAQGCVTSRGRVASSMLDNCVTFFYLGKVGPTISSSPRWLATARGLTSVPYTSNAIVVRIYIPSALKVLFQNTSNHWAMPAKIYRRKFP